MAHSGIPTEIKDFITRCIESVSQLEVLFIILKSNGKHWSAEEISRELRSHPSATLKQMQLLEEKFILHKDEDLNYYYRPKSPDTNSKILRLFDLYQERPVAIITFIYDRPADKLKGFADAFKLKKD